MNKRKLVEDLQKVVVDNPRCYCKAMIQYIDSNKSLERISNHFTNVCSSGGLTQLKFKMNNKTFCIMNFAGDHIKLAEFNDENQRESYVYIKKPNFIYGEAAAPHFKKEFEEELKKIVAKNPKNYRKAIIKYVDDNPHFNRISKKFMPISDTNECAKLEIIMAGKRFDVIEDSNNIITLHSLEPIDSTILETGNYVLFYGG